MMQGILYRGELRFEIHHKVKEVKRGELSWSEGRQRSRLVLHTEHGCLFHEIFNLCATFWGS